MNRRLLLPIALGLGSLAAVSARSQPQPIQPEVASVAAVAAPAPRTRARTLTLARGDTADGALRTLGAPEGARAVSRAVLAKLPVGAEVRADYLGDAAVPFRVRVTRDAASRVILESGPTGWSSREEPVAWDRTRRIARFATTPSLWESARDAGLSPGEILQIGHVFEYDLDLNTELRPGATLTVVAETLRGADGQTRPGEIEAARLQNGDQLLMAVRWRGSDGETGWFDPDGKARRRPFLRSPLELSEVTSGFSLSRFHPLLNVSRPHWGVDLGAPEGTPVRAVADGVVIRAGRAGGHGNLVELDHGAPYATSYSHLSSINVAVGAEVHQGDVIGRVGKTGLATGPHLHYQLTVDGAFVDPLTVELPQTGEVRPEDREAFTPVRDALMKLLDPGWTPTTARAADVLPSAPG